MDRSSVFQLAVAIASGGTLQWLVTRAARWLKDRRRQSGDAELSRETHIIILRKALDKSGIRFTGVVGACDALTLGYEIIASVLDEADMAIPLAARRSVETARTKLAEAVKALGSADG